MRETIFIFNQHLPSFEAMRGGKIEKIWGTFFNFFILRSSFPTPFSSETAVTEGEE